MKNVKIILKTETVSEEGQDSSSFTYQGSFESINGADYLKYCEITDGVRINTVIKAKDGTVLITRTGGVGSVLRIEAGKTHKTEYKTPYGVFSMAVKGEQCENRLSRDGILRASYTLLNESGVIGKNSIEILLKEV